MAAVEPIIFKDATTSLADYVDAGGYDALTKARAMTPEAVTEELLASELRGRGGCGWGTIVSVDHHYRTKVSADDVPSIVEELRGENG